MPDAFLRTNSKADIQRVRQRRVMGAASRIDTRQAHGSRGEPVHPDPRGEGFLIRDISHALRRYRNLVLPLSEGVREVENVALLTAGVRREELSEQEDAHQCPPDGAVWTRPTIDGNRMTTKPVMNSSWGWQPGLTGRDGRLWQFEAAVPDGSASRTAKATIMNVELACPEVTKVDLLAA
jgi:hypothetical protein